MGSCGGALNRHVFRYSPAKAAVSMAEPSVGLPSSTGRFWETTGAGEACSPHQASAHSEEVSNREPGLSARHSRPVPVEHCYVPCGCCEHGRTTHAPTSDGETSSGANELLAAEL